MLLLTLMAPRPLEDAVLDLVLSHPEMAKGFTTTHCSGHGSAVAFVGVAEHVAGRADRTRIELILAEDDVRRMLDLIREHFANANIFYWLSPVIESGRCA